VTPRWGIPVDIGGPEARDLALRELADPVYARAQPPWWQRAASWLWDRIGSLLGDLVGAANGVVWIIVLVAVVTLLALVVARRVGWVGRRHPAPRAVFTDRVVSAAEHRFSASDAAARSDWTTATLEIFRALVRSLEERGAVDTRPGRTADEAADAGASSFPAFRIALSDAARTFDEVAYGGRTGTEAGYQQVWELDASLRASSMVEQPA
jgi:hypothetical protein